jgi:hypothetical protein
MKLFRDPTGESFRVQYGKRSSLLAQTSSDGKPDSERRAHARREYTGKSFVEAQLPGPNRTIHLYEHYES